MHIYYNGITFLSLDKTLILSTFRVMVFALTSEALQFRITKDHLRPSGSNPTVPAISTLKPLTTSHGKQPRRRAVPPLCHSAAPSAAASHGVAAPPPGPRSIPKLPCTP